MLEISGVTWGVTIGVIVVSVDNRGTGGRGTAFRTATYKNLGQLEAALLCSASASCQTFP